MCSFCDVKKMLVFVRWVSFKRKLIQKSWFLFQKTVHLLEPRSTKTVAPNKKHTVNSALFYAFLNI